MGEGGERLSGGEAQRVALARAFLKDAPVLVLDEPTAQLDAATEARVVEAIARLRRGPHRAPRRPPPHDGAAADRVALVARGRVVEEGTPRELAAAGAPLPAPARGLAGGRERLAAARRRRSARTATARRLAVAPAGPDDRLRRRPHGHLGLAPLEGGAPPVDRRPVGRDRGRAGVRDRPRRPALPRALVSHDVTLRLLADCA